MFIILHYGTFTGSQALSTHRHNFKSMNLISQGSISGIQLEFSCGTEHITQLRPIWTPETYSGNMYLKAWQTQNKVDFFFCLVHPILQQTKYFFQLLQDFMLNYLDTDFRGIIQYKHKRKWHYHCLCNWKNIYISRAMVFCNVVLNMQKETEGM